MSSTVRMEEADKRRLRQLQDDWERVRGERPSQKELLGLALEFLEENKETFIETAGWEPFTEEEVEAVEQRALHMGEWDARDIDEIVYGS